MYMNINELVRSGANVTLAITVSDLREWSKGLIAETKRELEQNIIDEKTESYLTASQTCEKLGINPTTLWRWEKKEFLLPVRIGGKRRYKMSEIKSMLNR